MPKLTPRPSSLTESDFITAYGGIYEHSPWVAERIWSLVPGGSLDQADRLHEAMHKTVEAASHDEKLNLIKAHPDLAGKAALAGALSKDSTTEQAGAGLDRLSPEQFARFKTLNQAYKSRFGFPFIIAVRGLDADAILNAFERRLEHDAGQEFQTAMAEIHKIARLRLDAMEA
ncbi:OHCU decarboxylase [Iodidimonas nitroreducens]|uniref:2-oxo-4-hydroxy-4-carboxy-5-ureidoimidazoline decarboxylase n=1 Tax=Iodidimonas nitroreducens TaxID=1236968 RepID=A0A5A7N5D9_9PROT|nr:2-oxo-4-hydroxy-4-carboxy-5-ureidoimidazoline decarboxylase [Iodidimonas nitroreducens]GAK34305.1 2-oxo-4-hydroxy-4-carboxy-5-ureidoimidazoline decarboxylase [alpha proteobacterium Q-1]GER03533.1 OHCU decarboxylase [Iodidimonas nitroreducens]